jgi:pSer/pThr/pTyr-binding forkhead associated (FHA) protein/NADPH-dependent 2,4-dienoyl-CoA reductase/sulfur reductase-like enzyme/Fe-S-cluster-containing hydrogenase component 2/CRP-like cAMP-binding protein
MTHVILGDGVAGMSAAEVIRARRPQDRIVVISEDASPYYYRAALTNYLQGQVTDAELWALPPDGWQRLALERVHARVARVDPPARQVVLDDGRAVQYDRLLVATGARARAPGLDGEQLRGVQPLRTLADTKRLMECLPAARSAVVIGGGILGLEAAQGLIARNVRVTLLHRHPYVLERILDRRAAEIVQQRMEADGVQLVLGGERPMQPTACRGRDGRVREVALADGRVFPCDLVIAAVGNEPASECIAGAGIELDRGYVVTDPAMRISAHEHIYAAGDVVVVRDDSLPFRNPSGLWQPARKQGQVAGLNMAGRSAIEGAAFYRPGALYVATRAWDFDLGYVGETPRDAASLQIIRSEYRDRGRPIQKRAYLRDGHIVAAVLLGDRREGMAIRHLMNLPDAAGDVSAVADRLFDPSFDLMSWVEMQRRQPGVRRLDQTTIVPRGPIPPSEAAKIGTATQSQMAFGSARAARAAAPQSGPEITLHLPGRTLSPKNGTIRIGRGDDCDLRPSDPSLHDAVAIVRREGRVWLLSRTGSRAGDIRHNGSPVASPVQLADHDAVAVGDLKFHVRFRGSGEAAAESMATPPDAWLLGVARYPLGRAVTQVGSSPDNDIVVREPGVSPFHAQILLQGSTYFVVDFASEGGTFVGDAAVTVPRALVPGDAIRFGPRATLRFVTESRTAAASAEVQSDERRVDDSVEAFLVGVEGPLAGRALRLSSGSIIGRGSEADIRLADPLLSRTHARFEKRSGGWTVVDLGSVNGIAQGDERIAPGTAAPLRKGTRLRIGRNAFRFQEDEPGLDVQRYTPAASPAEDRATVRVVDRGSLVWEGIGKTWRLEGDEVRIGRAADNDVSIGAPNVSAHHARLTFAEGAWRISDEQSRHGVLVEGTRLAQGESRVLQDGVRIQLSDSVNLRFQGASRDRRPRRTMSGARVAWVAPDGNEISPISLTGAGPFVLGSDAARCAATFALPGVSRAHCEIAVTSDGCTIRDLKSTYGTRVGGTVITEVPVPLNDGDMIAMGQVSVAFHVESTTAIDDDAAPADVVGDRAAPPAPTAFRIDWARAAPFETDLHKFVEQELDACIGCHECMRACPLPDASVVTIGALNAAAGGHPLSDLVAKFAADCTQCHACVPVCPADIHRSKLVLWNKLKLHPDPDRRLLLQVGSDATPSPWTLGELSDVFSTHPLLGALSSHDRQHLLAKSRLQRLVPGERLIREGEFADALWVLVDGRLEIGMALAHAFQRMVVLTPGQTVGEVSVLSDQPCDVTAIAAEPATAVGLTKYALKAAMQASPAFRDAVNRLYVARSVEMHLKKKGSPLADVDDAALAELMAHLAAERYAAGDVIARQSDVEDAVFFVRRGFVSEVRIDGGTQIVSNYLKEGDVFGILGGERDARGSLTRYDAATQAEVLWVKRSTLDGLARRYPSLAQALAGVKRASAGAASARPLAAAAQMQATALMVIDTAVCVDCDNCVSACARRHGHSRLERVGIQVDRFLVPASCYHCNDPVCLLCAVDGIVREPSGEIRIVEESCIGCGACAERCPYGNIKMVSREAPGLLARILPTTLVHRFGLAPKADSERQRVAVKCDLCVGYDDGPACVRSCPVGAAMRVDPRTFFAGGAEA